VIYFIRSPDGLIKIGHTCNILQRMKDFRRANPSLEVVALLDGERPFERRLHAKFAHLRVFGEWFSPGDDLMEFIESDGREFDKDDPEHVRHGPRLPDERGEGEQERREQEKIVLAYLSSLSDERGRVGGDLSYRKIAERCNLGVKSARPAIERLIDQGHLVEFWLNSGDYFGSRFVITSHPEAFASLEASLRCKLHDGTRQSVVRALERLALARA
jgi:predicted transcriptional regulator